MKQIFVILSILVTLLFASSSWACSEDQMDEMRDEGLSWSKISDLCSDKGYETEEYDAPKKGKKKLPRYCCTQVGKLGPYQSDGTEEGENCYGTYYGQTHYGYACY